MSAPERMTLAELDALEAVTVEGGLVHRAIAMARESLGLREAARGMSAAISWLDYPFIDNNTSHDELLSRVGFMMKDAERHRQSLTTPQVAGADAATGEVGS